MINTILKIKEEDCYGCGACYNKCPSNAITMEYDKDGFLFPKLNEDKCVNCGLCLKACPAHENTKLRNPHVGDCYAVWADDSIRKQSSSGGMFSVLASHILEQGGYVCGAQYTSDYMNVEHTIISNSAGLDKLRGSKYVQSNTKQVYIEIEHLLKQGKPVLFTGCPCQVAGLYSFLDKEYENLYTADIVCHGANSVTAYQAFLADEAKGRKITKVDFREKKVYGWSSTVAIYYEDGTDTHYAWNQGTWYKGFLSGIINRKCCSSCPFATDKRVGDFTLADFWQIHRLDPKLDDRLGTSLVLINSLKGKQTFERIKNSLKLCKECSLDFAKQYNGCLSHPAPKAPGRRFFFEHLNTDGYQKSLWYGQKYRYDVGLVGWWFASNYGSILTYYALGKLLEDWNKLAIMIRIPKINHTPWEPQTQQSIEFLSRYFPVSKERPVSRMHECNQFCDAFMLGSDQLWVEPTIKLVGYTFFLDFVDVEKTKIAYSTSFGHDTFDASEEQLAEAKHYLSFFDHISVREDSGVNLCKEKFDLDVVRKLDPVFVCDRRHYDTLIENSSLNIKEKFLFCYILDPTEEKQQNIKYAAQKLGLNIIAITDLKTYDTASKKWTIGGLLEHPTVEDFLYCFKNCSFLITDSHHGVCFGLIYKKNLIAIANKTRGVTRFTSLMKLFNISERLIFSANGIKENPSLLSDMDYDTIEAIMKEECKNSKEWLRNALDMNSSKRKIPEKETLFLCEKIQRMQRKLYDYDYLEWKVSVLEDKIKNSEQTAMPIITSQHSPVKLVKKIVKKAKSVWKR